MVRLLVLYEKPIDTDAFEQRFSDMLIPQTKKMAGLRQFTVSRNVAPSLRGEPYYLVVELDWDDMEAMKRDFGSPEGKAAAVEAANVAALTTSARSMTYDLEQIEL